MTSDRVRTTYVRPINEAILTALDHVVELRWLSNDGRIELIRRDTGAVLSCISWQEYIERDEAALQRLWEIALHVRDEVGL
jgi:hypothetical protein